MCDYKEKSRKQYHRIKQLNKDKRELNDEVDQLRNQLKTAGRLHFDECERTVKLKDKSKEKDDIITDLHNQCFENQSKYNDETMKTLDLERGIIGLVKKLA